MRNQEMIDYYRRIVKAEDLKFFVEQAISTIQKEEKAIPDLYVMDLYRDDDHLPTNAERYEFENKIKVLSEDKGRPFKIIEISQRERVYSPLHDWINHFSGDVIGMWWAMAIAVVVFVLFAINADAFGGVFFAVIAGVFLSLPIGMALSAVLYWVLRIIFFFPTAKKEHDLKQEWNRKRFETRKQTEIVNRNNDTFRNQLCKEIVQMKDELECIRGQVEKIYNERDIPHQVRSMIAAHSILDYLEMGVCTELEGRDGAFAQFLEDVRVNKICSKLDDVVDAVNNLSRSVQGMTNAILSAQASLCEEIRQTRNRLDSFASDVHADMERIASQNELRQSSLDKLNSTQTAIVWNQYIAAQKMGISAGMRRS